jgi:hypothetical protein
MNIEAHGVLSHQITMESLGTPLATSYKAIYHTIL